MIYSMTGYGKHKLTKNGYQVSVEIKSLNSKGTDLNIRIPQHYKEKELEVRQTISNHLVRGKIDVYIVLEDKNPEGTVTLNASVATNYYNQLVGLADTLQLNKEDLLSTIIKLPGVMDTKEEEILDWEWALLGAALEEALKKVERFREQEGKALEQDFLQRIKQIDVLSKTINPHAVERIERIKSRIKDSYAKHSENPTVDQNRFEQELIFYLEKLDITEEIVRLKNHCAYFSSTLSNEDKEKGKKLGFIAQEIGREINTIGSKANDADIQKIVVQMKDELEKIKEQMNNIL